MGIQGLIESFVLITSYSELHEYTTAVWRLGNSLLEFLPISHVGNVYRTADNNLGLILYLRSTSIPVFVTYFVARSM